MKNFFMGTGNKNGKLHTIYIYITIQFLLTVFIPELRADRPGIKNSGKWVIVIDPGHGGSDPGALGSISKEKDINLAISLLTGNYLKQNLTDVEVIYTRSTDKRVDLIERPSIANKAKADLFISIHTNWAQSKSVMGAETFIMGLAKDEENLAVAMKENEVILLEDDYSAKYQGFDPKSPESYIIFTLMQNVYQKQSTDLAAKIQDQFRERVERKDRGVKQAGFWVLFNTSMPSVLIETGFITNPAEEKFLISKQGQEYIASAIYRAIRDYMSETDLKSGIKVIEQKEETASEAKGKIVSTVQPGEIIFMVQVNATSKRMELVPQNFKGISDIREISSGGRYRYATGNYRDYQEAAAYRKQIEKIFPDAFVIAVKDNNVLPLQQALEEIRKNK